MQVAKEVFNDTKPDAEATASISIIRAGSQPPVVGPTENFVGTVRVDSRFQQALPARVGGALVSFGPGARTAWHSHPLGQTLIVTAGVGRVQAWGLPPQPIASGDIVWIPPGVKHWHGAARDTGLSHAAISESLGGQSVEWMEQVADKQYMLSDPQ
ncbi:MAG: (R)-mandelonitrile lyase [Pseudoxanthomonas sp.]